MTAVGAGEIAILLLLALAVWKRFGAEHGPPRAGVAKAASWYTETRALVVALLFFVLSGGSVLLLLL